jgi:hypothetical protein
MQTHYVSGHSASENVETSVCATSDGAPLVDERAAASREPRSGEAAFECVYSTHVEFVWRSALRLGVDESAADDVVQQVFLVVQVGGSDVS